MKKNNNRPPMVSSLAMSFKRASNLSEDREEVKREHRTNLKALIDDYMGKVTQGKAEGIRTAKELVEVIKADLLLLGEATERTEEMNSVDEIKVTTITQALNENTPEVQAVIQQVFDSLNHANDHLDHTILDKKVDISMAEGTVKGVPDQAEQIADGIIKEMNKQNDNVGGE